TDADEDDVADAVEEKAPVASSAEEAKPESAPEPAESSNKDASDADDAERLVGLAISAMGHARHLGRNKYHLFDPTSRAEAQRRLELESQIRRAIQADGMLLHYQPRLRLSDGAVTGVEALLRLRDADGDLLSPNVFMAVAEDSGLMESMGLWALDRACADAAVLRNEGFDVPVAVNIAGDLFAKDTFQDELNATLQKHEVPGDGLELEISERAIQPARHGSLYTLQDRMTRIQRAGVRISLDNFGAGQTCLNDLRHLSIDNLKLSQDMIASVPDDQRMTSFVHSLLGVGKSLDMRVIAQGVETPEQMSTLRDMGCEDAQGFLFARPMALDKLKVTLRGLIEVWETAYGRPHAAEAG
ncbi:MAG: EAL domain-containing protein, partial [Pseudomonadota bacterium]